ncbi:hypothetical protein [Neorhizobium petrolearium]|uniref:Response regulator n=2 Tax=Neorhizobium petrolearium TaxID=515361 RepID=A0ABY8M2A1_9HYPH|nr:hypothetical protein [Neorhizobium petrolearium]MCC2608407.1 hypothetical protein [Neorhizobium petrolearium]WGI68685.1 hypothetical protein QEO92_00865 [Neorhizobium petrolearium]
MQKTLNGSVCRKRMVTSLPARRLSATGPIMARNLLSKRAIIVDDE